MGFFGWLLLYNAGTSRHTGVGNAYTIYATDGRAEHWKWNKEDAVCTCWHSAMCLILNQSSEMHQATVMRCTINSSTEAHCLQSNAQASWPQRPNSKNNKIRWNAKVDFYFGDSFRLFCFSAKQHCNLLAMQRHSSTATCYFHQNERRVIIFIPSWDQFNKCLRRRQYCAGYRACGEVYYKWHYMKWYYIILFIIAIIIIIDVFFT